MGIDITEMSETTENDDAGDNAADTKAPIGAMSPSLPDSGGRL